MAQVPYIRGYQALRAQRRAELAKLQHQAAERKPAARLILAVFFIIFGSLAVRMMPPIGAIFILVGCISATSGFKLIGVRRRVKRVLADENTLWNIRDRAVDRLGDKDFDTLAKSLEANGSYESLSTWLARKDFDEADINTLILAAASAGEERQKMQVSEDLKARAGVFANPDQRAQAHYDAAFAEESEAGFAYRDDDEAPETSSEEGLHAQLLAEEQAGAPAAMPPKTRRSEADPELDEIRQRVADAQRRRRGG
ncbi:MAG: hypothetical protein KDB07_11830 [Planctomycetes bacterium]|nr:hypothetical protein [Planctomycetota bacterium]